MNPSANTQPHLRPRAGMPLSILFSVTALVLAGCREERTQSMLHPAGPGAQEIAWLWWFMLIILTAVFVIVMLLLLWGIFRSPSNDAEAPGGSTRFIVIGGIVLPAIILVVLMFYSLGATVALRNPTEGLRVQVIGHRWWWEVRYPDQDIITANEIHIPVGEPVLLELLAGDVIHSFWVPELTGKMDLLPETMNRFWMQADREGRFRGQCAEFCGLQHALMAFWVVALPREEFDQWVDERQRPHPELADERLIRGREVFFAQGCHACHAIRGTEAEARAGPDLTHIATRLTLGAGTIANNPGNLSGWITNPQPIKPGNLMPPTFMEPNDLHALRDYLLTLE
jgi:cytochrome c oxidase subunit II